MLDLRCRRDVNMRAPLLFGVILLLVCLPIQAQWCPPGYVPIGGDQAGWKGCAPITGPSQSVPDPGPRWATRWGAIAVDNVQSAWGYFDGAPNKRRAAEAAVESCKRNGGKKCKVYISYHNQCGALASGDDRITTFSAPESGLAELEAVKSCSEKTGNCAVIHSGCSYPQKID